MSDIVVHVQINGRQPNKVTVPTVMKASDFISELVGELQLPLADEKAGRVNWVLATKLQAACWSQAKRSRRWRYSALRGQQRSFRGRIQ
jgi:hypothetical protein